MATETPTSGRSQFLAEDADTQLQLKLIHLRDWWNTQKLAGELTVPEYLTTYEERQRRREMLIDGRYKIVHRITDAGGSFNKGISVVQDTVNKMMLLCKEVGPGCAQQEYTKLYRLHNHPHITHLHNVSEASQALCCFPGEEGFEETYSSTDRDRMYLDWCDRGTLGAVIKRYQYLPIRIPERFIWTVFEGLASAILFCHTGKRSVGDVHHRTAYWDPIIHRDIIPENIFLSSVNNADPTYPRVILGDFGCAFLGSELEAVQSGYLGLDEQDLRFIAPETLAGAKNDLLTNIYDKPSDIYQIGLVTWCLCYQLQFPLNPGRNYCLAVQQREVDCAAWPYSSTLRPMLNACLDSVPEHRPNAEELLHMVQVTSRALDQELPHEILFH